MTIKATLDRFEADKAVLLLGAEESDTVGFPTAYLPQDLDEGDHLEITITRDREATAAAYQEAASLLAEIREGKR